MPPRRGRSRKVLDPPSPDPPPPPAEQEDAKPDVEQLDAQLDAQADNVASSAQTGDGPPPPDQTLPSDPLSTSTTHALPHAPTLDTVSDAPATIASAAPRGRAFKTGQPRGTRRSAAARAELVRLADEREKVEADARAKETARANRARGLGRSDGARRGGRGRGGFMGQPDRGSEQPVASGPFSGGQVHKESRHIKRPAPSSGWTGLSADAKPREPGRPSSRRTWSHGPLNKTESSSGGPGATTVKTEPGSSADAKPVLDRDGDVRMNYVDGGYISSDEEDDPVEGMERVNIDDFGVVDLTQDDEEEGGYYAPVRVMRVERKQAGPDLNAEGATNQDGEVAVDANDSVAEPSTTTSRKGKQKATAEAQPEEYHKYHFQAVYSDSDENPTLQEPQVKPDPDPIPTEPGAVNEGGPSSPENRRKGKERAKAARAPSPVLAAPGSEYNTREDLQEWERTQNDLRIMRSELGSQPGRVDPTTDGAASTTDSRADKVYLFQFPPVLPELIPAQGTPLPPSDNPDPDIMPVDLNPTSTSNPTDDPKIKLEPTTSIDASTVIPHSFPTGAVGKLRVRASGRVELDWGGTAMSMGLGTEAAFLQDLMLVGLPEGKVGADEVAAGEAVSMGRVRGKFVVGLDWGELLS